MSNTISELKDTIELMTSGSYNDRFVAELLQVKIRRQKLFDMLIKWDKLDFVPKCPKEIFETQLSIMDSYIAILEARRTLYEKE